MISSKTLLLVLSATALFSASCDQCLHNLTLTPQELSTDIVGKLYLSMFDAEHENSFVNCFQRTPEEDDTLRSLYRLCFSMQKYDEAFIRVFGEESWPTAIETQSENDGVAWPAAVLDVYKGSTILKDEGDCVTLRMNCDIRNLQYRAKGAIMSAGPFAPFFIIRRTSKGWVADAASFLPKSTSLVACRQRWDRLRNVIGTHRLLIEENTSDVSGTEWNKTLAVALKNIDDGGR